MLYLSRPRGGSSRRQPNSNAKVFGALLVVAACFGAARTCAAQQLTRELTTVGASPEIVVHNDSGRVTIIAEGEERKSVSLIASSPGAAVSERDVQAHGGGRVEVSVRPRAERDRIDLTLRVPARARLRVETQAGMVDVSGTLSAAEIVTNTGTIRADVPTDALSYSFRWTASRPRFFSEIELGKIKEHAGGRFELRGQLGDKRAPKSQHVRLDLQTARGLVLFGVDPAMVPSDLRERPLTEAARGIIRSGNVEMIDAIRKVAPRYVGEYAETLPPRVHAPMLANFNAP